MHIALLVTNIDDSAFAARHPGDGEKFDQLLRSQRPDWRVSLFNLPQQGFPESLDTFDGFLIGGSPASVHDDAPWIARLAPLVRQIVSGGQPLFGACFGHQAIAVALGGTVARNPGGWVLGVTETTMDGAAPWMAGDGGPVRMNAAHLEQVTRLPAGATVIGGNPDCPVGSFRVGTSVFTTQYHPEMTPDFIEALVEELAPTLPPGVADRARASLNQPAERDRVAGWIVRFFEQG